MRRAKGMIPISNSFTGNGKRLKKRFMNSGFRKSFAKVPFQITQLNIAKLLERDTGVFTKNPGFSNSCPGS
jgi:hypothetical protein